MKKRIKIAVLAVTVLLALFAFSAGASAQDNITVVLDGAPLSFDQEPVIIEGRTLVPLRGIFEAMGATVKWNDETRSVTATKGDTTVSLTIGDNIIYKNGEAIELDVPAQIVNSRTLAPARAVSESFGARVGWNSEKKYVVISTDTVLNSALEKLYAANEIVTSFEVKSTDFAMNVKEGMDYENEKELTQYLIETDLIKINSTTVIGEGKKYTDINGEVNVYDVDMEGYFERSTDEDICKFVRETDEYKVYSTVSDVGDSMEETLMYVNKSNCVIEKLVLSKEAANELFESIDQEIDINIAFDTGEVIKMWNKYNK